MSERNIVVDFARCRPFIEAALTTCRTHTLADITAGIERGKYHFWPGQQSAAITEVMTFPRQKVFNVFLAGGDLAELLEMEPLFCSFAAFLGCDELSIMGRAGWARVLKDRGWHPELVVLSKKVEQPSR